MPSIKNEEIVKSTNNKASGRLFKQVKNIKEADYRSKSSTNSQNSSKRKNKPENQQKSQKKSFVGDALTAIPLKSKIQSLKSPPEHEF